MVAPDEEADDGDEEARERDEVVPEDPLAREGGDELAHHAHRRQDHDVDGGVRVEPEEVLEEDRVAAVLRVEDADVEEPLGADEEDRDRDDRRPEDLDDARRVVGPDEEGEPEPGEARGPHPVDRDDEVEARQDRREARDEDAERRDDDLPLGEGRRHRRVEGPARVDAARQERHERHDPADHVEVPAQEVDAREREVLRPDHDRQQEVAEHRRDRRDQEEEDHQDAVHREEPVVDVGGEEVSLRRRQLGADQHGHQAAEDEEDRDAEEVEDADPLVVPRQEPRPDAVGGVQVVRLACIPAGRGSGALTTSLRRREPRPPARRRRRRRA